MPAVVPVRIAVGVASVRGRWRASSSPKLNARATSRNSDSSGSPSCASSHGMVPGTHAGQQCIGKQPSGLYRVPSGQGPDHGNYLLGPPEHQAVGNRTHILKCQFDAYERAVV